MWNYQPSDNVRWEYFFLFRKDGFDIIACILETYGLFQVFFIVVYPMVNCLSGDVLCSYIQTFEPLAYEPPEYSHVGVAWDVFPEIQEVRNNGIWDFTNRVSF